MSDLKLFIWSGDEFGSRFLGSILNFSEFCRSCAESCTHCRQHLPTAATNIVAFEEVPANLPSFIEEPEELLPNNPPKADIIVAIGIHADLLAALPELATRSGAKAVIVPIENPQWCNPGLQRQTEEDLQSRGLEFAFPRPFCALEPSPETSTINQFMEEFFIGRPLMQAGVDGEGIVRQMSVERSAPCGCTHYVAQMMRWCPVADRELEDQVSKAHHAYPCTGAMINDPVLGDTPLHIGGYIAREEVKNAVARNLLPFDEIGLTAPTRSRLRLGSSNS
ncbi:MAG: DUF166 domain-containing protein [Candidatus Heimdallarchaeota archaeon]